MGVHVDITTADSDLVNSIYREIFEAEIRSEILLLKDKIIELENRLQDPYG